MYKYRYVYDVMLFLYNNRRLCSSPRSCVALLVFSDREVGRNLLQDQAADGIEPRRSKKADCDIEGRGEYLILDL